MKSIPAVLPAINKNPRPAGTCDVHTHIFGPFDRYPLRHVPDFSVPLSPQDTHREMLARAGSARGVLVAPTQNGCDNERLLAGLGEAKGRLRGVGALRGDARDEQIAEMNEAGVRGLRFVESPLPDGSPRPGAVEFAQLPQLAPRMGEVGWAAHAWGPLPTLMANLDAILQPQVEVVFEHMGMLNVSLGLQDANFQRMLALLREGRIWVKLSVCRCSVQAPAYADLRPFHDALVEANPDQLLWGSDWPYIRMEGIEPDAGVLLDLFCEWVADPEIQSKVLVDNPARLYGFSD